MQFWKDLAQILSYVAGSIAILLGAGTYWRARRLEAAKWALQLYERFYEKDTFKGTRTTLDCDASQEPAIEELVRSESAEFTDYLNFFEFIAYLKHRGQISDADVDGLFSYYLGCLKRPAVYNYIKDPNKGYEYLSDLLDDRGELRVRA